MATISTYSEIKPRIEQRPFLYSKSSHRKPCTSQHLPDAGWDVHDPDGGQSGGHQIAGRGHRHQGDLPLATLLLSWRKGRSFGGAGNPWVLGFPKSWLAPKMVGVDVGEGTTPNK